MIPFILALAVASAGARTDQPLRRGISWDAEVALGFAVTGPARLGHRFVGRGRFGLLVGDEPWFLTMGATIEGAGLPRFAGGVQIGFAHLWSGVWAETGIAVGLDPALFVHASAGFTLVGVEWQRRITGAPGDDRPDAIIIKLRIPIGLYIFAR